MLTTPVRLSCVPENPTSRSPIATVDSRDSYRLFGSRFAQATELAARCQKESESSSAFESSGLSRWWLMRWLVRPEDFQAVGLGPYTRYSFWVRPSSSPRVAYGLVTLPNRLTRATASARELIGARGNSTS